jgi:hypothetical protein
MHAHRLTHILGASALVLLPRPLAAQPAQVSAIEARLFFSTTGRFSDNILKLGKAAPLRNAVIGAGNLEGPTRSTLFIVRISGAPGEYLARVKVKVTVRKRSRSVLSRTYEPGIFGAAGDAYVPVLVDDTGCDPLTIEARVTEPTPTAPKTGVIPFECGS